jgi:hypothetical protein
MSLRRLLPIAIGTATASAAIAWLTSVGAPALTWPTFAVVMATAVAAGAVIAGGVAAFIKGEQ